jgi:hypothetical protein
LYGEGFLCENWFELVELYEHYLTLNSSRTGTATQTAYWGALNPEERSAEMSRRVTLHWSLMNAEERRAQTAAWSAAAGKALSVRWAAMTPEERVGFSARAGARAKARWASMTPEERSAEMRRRQAVRWAKVRAERALRSLGADLHGAMWADEAL